MIKRCQKHDAHYDDEKDEWDEVVCPDPSCKFCKDRPEKPSQVK